MKYYIEAFDVEGRQILGNLNGQAVIQARKPWLTKSYKILRDPTRRPAWPRVWFWRLVREDGTPLEEIPNSQFPGALAKTRLFFGVKQ